MQLEKVLKGRVIKDIKILSSKSFPDDPKKILDTKILDTRRFGKVLVIGLNNNHSLLVHLKLTGQLLVDAAPGPHTRVIITLDKGKLIFNDLRIFGWMKIVNSERVIADRFVKKLGPEPFKDLTLKKFSQSLSLSKRPIKIVLMDQEKISGVGNIYANDALWLARVNPRQPARRLDSQTARQLYEAILTVLKNGLKYGGASDQHYLKPDGTKGKYQEHFLVYGRQGKPCSRCRTPILKFFLGGRGTFYCPKCQK